MTTASEALAAAEAVRPYLELAEPVPGDEDGSETTLRCLETLADWPRVPTRTAARRLLRLLRGERHEGRWLAQMALRGDRRRCAELERALR